MSMFIAHLCEAKRILWYIFQHFFSIYLVVIACENPNCRLHMTCYWHISVTCKTHSANIKEKRSRNAGFALGHVVLVFWPWKYEMGSLRTEEWSFAGTAAQTLGQGLTWMFVDVQQFSPGMSEMYGKDAKKQVDTLCGPSLWCTVTLTGIYCWL